MCFVVISIRCCRAFVLMIDAAICLWLSGHCFPVTLFSLLLLLPRYVVALAFGFFPLSLVCCCLSFLPTWSTELVLSHFFSRCETLCSLRLLLRYCSWTLGVSSSCPSTSHLCPLASAAWSPPRSTRRCLRSQYVLQPGGTPLLIWCGPRFPDFFFLA